MIYDLCKGANHRVSQFILSYFTTGCVSWLCIFGKDRWFTMAAFYVPINQMDFYRTDSFCQRM